jgi:hypothetical protein
MLSVSAVRDSATTSKSENLGTGPRRGTLPESLTRFSENWSFQTGLNFISKGVKGNGVTDAWDVVDVTINQLYLELPLMVGARIHTASNFDLLFKGGPYLAYGVGGKTKIDGVSEKADTFGDDDLLAELI